MNVINIPFIIGIGMAMAIAQTVSAANGAIGYYLGFTLNFGPTGIWIGFLIGLSISSVLLILRLRKKMSSN